MVTKVKSVRTFVDFETRLMPESKAITVSEKTLIQYTGRQLLNTGLNTLRVVTGWK